ncbi:MAG: hypothetical protein HYT36_02895 [Candidatus Staskawiczbacteria bacterium]|nr:hypothetical protein [Candidatus Staskawiczbacteria bacterium]
MSLIPVPDNLLAEWQAFYKLLFNFDFDFSGLSVQKQEPDFNRLIVVARGISPQILWQKCEELFPCHAPTTDNWENIRSDRTSEKGHYAVWVEDEPEASNELEYLSANQIKKHKIPSMTIEERLVFGIKFFAEKADHLDKTTWTLCSGSSCDCGLVPIALFHDKKFLIEWNGPDRVHNLLRARAVIY